MGLAEDIGSPIIAVGNGLSLIPDGAGMWLVRKPDGAVWAVEDRLACLLPLLERRPAEVTAAFGQVAVELSPLPALIRFALTSWGHYWPGLALGWLEAGWPVTEVLDVLATMKDSSALPQPLRHRALRLWNAAAATT